jgi:hypothetical protein
MLCFAIASLAQLAIWQREDKTDPLRGAAIAQYSLTGKFLTPPKRSPEAPPVFVIKCNAGTKRSRSGLLDGKLLDAFIAIGAEISHSSAKVPVQYRLDDGKMHNEAWNIGAGGTAVFLPPLELNTVLYGHFLTHKEGTNPPVRKLVLGLNEHRGAEVVVQFDLPDPDEMADACGLLYRKK